MHCIKKTKVNCLSVGVRTKGFFPAISGKNSLYMITRGSYQGWRYKSVFFLQMIRANTDIVRRELIDGFCVNEVPALAIAINIDKIVLQDLKGNDMVPK